MSNPKMKNMAQWLIYGGIVLLAAGLVLYFAPGLFRWFGKLPGDIHIESEKSRLYIPITSTLLVSLVLSLLIRLIRAIKK